VDHHLPQIEPEHPHRDAGEQRQNQNVEAVDAPAPRTGQERRDLASARRSTGLSYVYLKAHATTTLTRP
jgi:hypothetical protein